MQHANRNQTFYSICHQKFPMASIAPDVRQKLETVFGTGQAYNLQGISAVVWVIDSYHIVWSDSRNETKLRKIWKNKEGSLGTFSDVTGCLR